MAEDIASIVEQFKDLNDLEFEIMFIDGIAKKFKSLDKPDLRTETLLFMYFGIVETLKKFKVLVKEGNRSIPHSDMVDLIIEKCDKYLSSVADDQSRAPYVQQSLSDVNELVKSLLFTLKKELTDTPEYAHLKPHGG